VVDTIEVEVAEGVTTVTAEVEMEETADTTARIPVTMVVTREMADSNNAVEVAVTEVDTEEGAVVVVVTEMERVSLVVDTTTGGLGYVDRFN
jgi:hypothetical protein